MGDDSFLLILGPLYLSASTPAEQPDPGQQKQEAEDEEKAVVTHRSQPGTTALADQVLADALQGHGHEVPDSRGGQLCEVRALSPH